MTSDSKAAIEFVAKGAPKDLARAIEEFARGRGSVAAIVVPWESDATTISLAVTSVKADGWAIEHTNLGTIRLTDLGGAGTRVAIVAHAAEHAERQRLDAVFDRFAQQVRHRFAPAESPADRLRQGSGGQEPGRHDPRS